MPERVAFYMDVHIPEAISKGLRARGIKVVTTQEDQNHEMPDSDLLDRAFELGCILYTQDQDFFVIASERLRNQQTFTGIVYSKQQTLAYGQIIEELELIAQCCTFEELQNRLEYLPFK
jgi:predicted nuclease of predicted toxin-antitoxin system